MGAARQVILVTSPEAGDGKSTTAANLAMAYAESGQSVLLVNWDLWRPIPARVFDAEDAPASASSSRPATPRCVHYVHSTSVPGLHLVPAGKLGHQPGAQLDAELRLLEEARSLADVVIIDTAPLLAASVTRELVTMADVVVLVSRAGRTTSPAAERTAELLERLGAPTLGVALVGVPSGVFKNDYYGKPRRAPIASGPLSAAATAAAVAMRPGTRPGAMTAASPNEPATTATTTRSTRPTVFRPTGRRHDRDGAAAPPPGGVMPTSARMVAVAAHGLAGSRTDLPHEPLSEVEWFDLVQGCVAADLVGLLAAAAAAGHLPVTAGQAEELDVLAAEHAGLSTLVERHAVTMASLLEIAGIDHRVVDGPARGLAYRDGGHHPVRPVRRVQILVAPARRDDARALQGVRPALPDGPLPRHERLVVVDTLPGIDPAPRADLPALLGGPARLDLDGRSVPSSRSISSSPWRARPCRPRRCRRSSSCATSPNSPSRQAWTPAPPAASPIASGRPMRWPPAWRRRGRGSTSPTRPSCRCGRCAAPAPRADRTAGRVAAPSPRVGLAQRVLGRRTPAPAAAVVDAAGVPSTSAGVPWSSGGVPVPSAAEGYGRPHRSTRRQP